MKVVLLKDLPGLGRKSEVKEVQDGYGRNFLIAKGFAAQATEKVLTQLNSQLKQKAEHDRKLIDKYRNIKNELDKRTFTVEARVGTSGQIFGSVSEKDLLQKISEKLNLELDKKQIDLPKIKQIGEYSFNIKLTSDIIAHPKVKVINQSDHAKK